MRLILNFLMLLPLMSFGQMMEHDTVAVYEIKQGIVAAEEYVQIPVNFDEDDLLKSIPDNLKELAIMQIDLVYTVYKTNPAFDQLALNKSRIQKFKKAFPGADDPLINWKTVGQSQALTRESAQQMFHGFVIYYRPRPTKESIETEISYIDAYLGLGEDGNVEKNEKENENEGENEIEDEEVVAEDDVADVYDPTLMAGKASDVVLGFDGEVEYSEWELEDLEGKCYISTVYQFEGNKKLFDTKIDSIKRTENYGGFSYSSRNAKGKGVKRYDLYIVYLTDTCDFSADYAVTEIGSLSSPLITYVPNFDNEEYGVVEAVFKRHPDWQNSLVVMDVTGSMSPYIAKTMAWVKATQDSSQVEAFTFFNDGDMKSDRYKVTGHVGGIYGARNTAFKPVYNTMLETMRKGGGGDCPENNIEATIKAMDDFPGCDEVIMVADNWATPRDLSYVRELRKPVHVIVCGGTAGINLAYIQLALDTGGSIHTIENDLDSRDIKAGESFRVGKFYYGIVKGRVVRAEIK
ncbi:hypothetical protein K6119_15830 [Paracrocinitomix mangrovi]|uniref:hypothetical protein n=1 Tax=Paracrocinitomix mangrovi TaxID=2862509 RepID=UPI001C8D9134|nr:hypothetical protein [Paracrocinitomix mangrovi]UKN01200.1 hypothetical protein K6119_15830 [Paracrocinitomix mangrovi]